MSAKVVIALAILTVATVATGNGSNSSSTVSFENEVLHFSYELERLLDTAQSPCNDFFAFVCGKSLNISADQKDERLQQDQQRFEQFLTTTTTTTIGIDGEEHLTDAELKMKHFHDSCRLARSVDDLKSSLMYRLSGGWPVLEDASVVGLRKRRGVHWLQMLSAFHNVGASYFFQQRIAMKSNKRVIHLQPDETTRYSLRKLELLAEEMMHGFSVEPGRARLAALEILSFERSRREALRNISADEVGSEKHLTYAEFKALPIFVPHSTPPTDWDAYFKLLLGKCPRSTDTIVVQHFPKLERIFGLVQNTTMTRLLNWIWIDYLMDKSIRDCQTLVQSYFKPAYEQIVQRSSFDKVQMVNMYSALGRAYASVLVPTAWVDEMSQQQSQQFLGRAIHFALNGDEKLDTDLAALTITKRNFYRNLEKLQRFQAQRAHERNSDQASGHSSPVNNFMQVFHTVQTLLQQQNLTAPLNYALFGERFAEFMIIGGGITSTPGSWRSMDSEREYATFRQCIMRQDASSAISTDSRTPSMTDSIVNDLLVKILANHQTLEAFRVWRQTNEASVERLELLLAAGRLRLNLQRLHFIGSLLSECNRWVYQSGGKHFLQSYLRNSPTFSDAFNCHNGDKLYAQSPCRIL